MSDAARAMLIELLAMSLREEQVIYLEAIRATAFAEGERVGIERAAKWLRQERKDQGEEDYDWQILEYCAKQIESLPTGQAVTAEQERKAIVEWLRRGAKTFPGSSWFDSARAAAEAIERSDHLPKGETT